LNGYYSSSLRDIRRTYQRAFKALLFAHRFPLSSKRRADGHSELGFFLAHPENFAGLAYYSSGGTYVQHAAYCDFNFLPLVDNYHAPTAAQDSRTSPSAQQSQAMFDWWERIIDYVHARDQVWSEFHCDLWALFDEAVQNNPADLLRHMGARKRWSVWPGAACTMASFSNLACPRREWPSSPARNPITWLDRVGGTQKTIDLDLIRVWWVWRR
jgi:hypothetical protein